MSEIRIPVPVAINEILIDESGLNCRREKITPISVKNLQEDIQKRGLDQPVHVKHLPPNHPSGKKFQLLAGFRRTISCRNLGMEFIPAFVRDDVANELDVRAFNIRENLQRKDLSIIDEAYALKPFLEFGASPSWIAEKLGMPKRWVQERIDIGKLPDLIQDEVAAHPNWFKPGHLEKMLDMGLEEAQKYVHDIKQHAIRGETLPVRGKHKSTGTSERKRSVGELVALKEAIYDCLGPGIETRILAWAHGAISTFDIVDDLAHRGCQQNKMFIVPPELIESD
jgi:ParB/RepB/Spo0J family partition protein